MMLLRKKKRERMDVREEPWIRCPAHLAYVRRVYECSASGRPGHVCQGRMEAHHVRLGSDGAGSVKPSDSFAIPTCSGFHSEIHNQGEATTQAKHKLDFLAIAAEAWRRSPHGIAWRRDHG